MTQLLTSCRPVGFSVSLICLAGLALGQNPAVPSSPFAAAVGEQESESTLTQLPGEPAGPAELVEPLIPIHTSSDDEGYAYGIWAAGPGYKMSFHDGATFVPMLGRDYPHNQPFTWRTESAKVGSTELVTQNARLSYAGLRAEYDLGQIVEAYDLRDDGVEQTFVISKRPPRGDLVIRGVVKSMLQTQAVGHSAQSLSFVDGQGLELVTYGAATAVDATGATRTMTTAFENGRITLRLAGEWLEAATFPVVVDPLIGPGAQVTGFDRTEVDMVRDSESTGGGAWMAYSVYVSAADIDLYVRRWDDDGNWNSVAFTDLSNSWSAQGASCAYNAFSNKAIIAFDRLFLNGTRRTRFHSHSRLDYTQTSNVHAISSSGNQWRCSAGGTVSNLGGSDLLVVWQQEANAGAWSNTLSSQIYGCLIDTLTNTHATPFVIANGSFQDQERPSVNRMSRGARGNHWLVAYQTISSLIIGSGDDWDVAVRKVDVNGVSASIVIDNGSPDHKMAPVVSGMRDRYLVAFTSSTRVQQPGKPSGINGHQIRSVRVDWSGTASIGTEPWGTNVIQSNSDPRLELAGLGHDHTTQSHWALMFRSTATEILYLRTMGYRGAQLQSEVVFNPSGSDESVRGAVTFNGFEGQFMLAYGNSGSPTYVTYDRFFPPLVLGSYASGTACSPASIEWSGSQQIGSEFGNLRVNGAANDSLHVMVMATGAVSQILFGIPPIQDGCWLLVPNTGADFAGLFDLRIGSSPTWDLPLPEYLTSDTFYFQDFHTIGGGDFTLISTQRLALPIIK